MSMKNTNMMAWGATEVYEDLSSNALVGVFKHHPGKEVRLYSDGGGYVIGEGGEVKELRGSLEELLSIWGRPPYECLVDCE